MSRPLHIVQLVNFYGPRSGGIRTALDQFGRGYVDAGHRRTIVVPHERDDDVVEGAHRVVRVAAPVIPGSGGYRAILDLRRVASVLAEDPPDVVELSDKTTLLPVARAARRRGAAVVLISHERLDAVLRSAAGASVPAAWVTGRWNQGIARSVDAIVCASEFAAAEFRPWATVPIHRVDLGVDLATFQPASSPRSEFPTVVVAVRLSPEKRPELIVETSRELVRSGVDHRMLVFGDGPLRARLERAAAGLPVVFRGHVADRAALARAMSLADAAIAPGPAETFGLAALELLACGTPVVVPEAGSLREVVGHAGLVRPRTPHDFAAAVRELLAGDRDEQRRVARAHAERYTWAAATASMLEVFDAVLGRQPAAARSNL